MYSVRLYELLIQWREAKKTPLFDLKVFRGQLGVDDDEYERMCDFKSGVLNKAIKEINKHTDIKVSYEQEKDGKNIIGFKFTVHEKPKPKSKPAADSRDGDMFTIDRLSDKQLGRIARNPQFIADYNHMVSSTSPAGQSEQAWEFEMINRLKKDASQFKKRPISKYLE